MLISFFSLGFRANYLATTIISYFCFFFRRLVEYLITQDCPLYSFENVSLKNTQGKALFFHKLPYKGGKTKKERNKQTNKKRLGILFITLHVYILHINMCRFVDKGMCQCVH